MKVRFTTTFRAGEIYDLPPFLANALIQNGYAQDIDPHYSVNVIGPSCRQVIYPGEYKNVRRNQNC